MIVTRTPFRITLGGGGTDLPSFYQEHGGFLVAVAINKYMYLNVNTPILDDLIRVRYSKTEIVSRVEEVSHTLARAALSYFGIKDGIEINSIADIPAGTGLGSSSCYLVGLLNALHALVQNPVSPQQLAEEACHIELDLLKKPIGKQDQFMASFGGLVVLNISRSGEVSVQPLAVSPDVIEELESNLLLFYTGEVRDATTILAQQNDATKRNDSQVVGSLTEIKDIGIETAAALVSGNLRRFGELMHEHWMAKKRLAKGISNPHIDAWYDLARKNGAIGGKISGAGGGGFLMLYCDKGKAQLRKALRAAGLRELSFMFEFEGSKVVFDIVSRDGRLAHMHRNIGNGRRTRYATVSGGAALDRGNGTASAASIALGKGYLSGAES